MPESVCSWASSPDCSCATAPRNARQACCCSASSHRVMRSSYPVVELTTSSRESTAPECCGFARRALGRTGRARTAGARPAAGRRRAGLARAAGVAATLALRTRDVRRARRDLDRLTGLGELADGGVADDDGLGADLDAG